MCIGLVGGIPCRVGGIDYEMTFLGGIPCRVFCGRLSTRVWPSLVDLGVLLPQRALPWKRGPNPGLGSRSRLAVDVREHGLQLVDHWSSLLRLVGRLHSTTGDPSSVPSSQMGRLCGHCQCCEHPG